LNVGRLDDHPFSQDEVEFLSRVASQVAIAVENASAFREIAELKEKLAGEKLYLEEEIRTEHNFEEIIGQSAALRRVLRLVETVATTPSTVLIHGETGTGKELIARAIHHLSPRRDRTFVKLNCAAIPLGLLESELFGHEKGAFTGAISQKIGRFELAHQGTLFLDEIGDIPLEPQAKLLRVLQEQEFERLGGTRTTRVDVRLIAATNRDLAKMVSEQKFREDLYYRLNVFPIAAPPLRERREDIPLLVRYFVQQFARRADKQIEAIPKETMEVLVQWSWPVNIRELQNVIERAVILSAGSQLQVPLSDFKTEATSVSSAVASLVSVEREHIVRVIREARGVIGGPLGAAARLGMKRTTLQARMRKLGISRQVPFEGKSPSL
jgi:formate hydrogenlyase transcriptional activator